MAELMGIPHVHRGSRDIDPPSLLEQADFDVFEARYRHSTTCGITENGLRHRLEDAAGNGAQRRTAPVGRIVP